MSYQENDKIRVKTTAAIPGQFIAIDEKDPKSARVHFDGIEEDVTVPIDSIMYEDDSDEVPVMQISDELKKFLEKQMYIMNFHPKRR